MTNLALVTTTPAAAGTTKRTTFRNPQTRVMQQLAVIWNAMSGTDKSTWKNLAGQMTHTNKKGMPSKVSAYARFIEINSMLLGAGEPVNTIAPLAPEAPYPMPALTLTASTSALTLTSAAAYGPNIIIYAAAPLLAGTNDYPASAFKRIGYIASLSTVPVDITAQYLAVYNIPSAGYEIAINLVGVMDSGFYTPRTLVTAVVTA
jgi:hypothetical protein